MPTTSFPDDLTPTEAELYKRFRDAFESYAKLSWDIERLNADNKNAAFSETNAGLTSELARIQILVKEAMRTLGDVKTFGQDEVGSDGLANTIQRRIERDVLRNFDADYPSMLKSAQLNEFLKREKESRASIYKKHVRRGFKSSTEELIGEEKEKNEAWRETMLSRLSELFSPEDIELIRTAFRRRMARHGMQE